MSRYLFFRPGRREPAGRRLRERAAAAGLRAPAHRGAGHDGRAPVRHLQAAAGLARVRVEDTHQVLRDRVGQAWIHRGNKAQGEKTRIVTQKKKKKRR